MSRSGGLAGLIGLFALFVFVGGAGPRAAHAQAMAQDFQCTEFPNHPCWSGCCGVHDQCYINNGCTADSWGTNQGGEACDNCNMRVVECILGHLPAYNVDCGCGWSGCSCQTNYTCGNATPACSIDSWCSGGCMQKRAHCEYQGQPVIWWTWEECGAECGSGPTGYQGCFTDDGNRALNGWSGGGFSIQGCINQCASLGYLYAGSQWYDECWCGNSLGYSQVGDGECNTPCNYGGGYCGGGWHNSIYGTGAGGSGGGYWNTLTYAQSFAYLGFPGGGGGGGSMQQNSAIRNCSGYSEHYIGGRGSAQECYDSCAGYNAVEWNQNGDCYCENGSGCQIVGGFGGWWAGLR